MYQSLAYTPKWYESAKHEIKVEEGLRSEGGKKKIECPLQPKHLVFFFFLPRGSSGAGRLMVDERERQERKMRRRGKAHRPPPAFLSGGSLQYIMYREVQ